MPSQCCTAAQHWAGAAVLLPLLLLKCHTTELNTPFPSERCANWCATRGNLTLVASVPREKVTSLPRAGVASSYKTRHDRVLRSIAVRLVHIPCLLSLLSCPAGAVTVLPATMPRRALWLICCVAAFLGGKSGALQEHYLPNRMHACVVRAQLSGRGRAAARRPRARQSMPR